MEEWLQVAGSRGLGRVTGFCIGLAIISGDPEIAVMGFFGDVLYSVVDTARLRSRRYRL